MLRLMVTSQCFSSIFKKGDKFSDFLYASLHFFSKLRSIFNIKNLLLGKKIICWQWNKLLPLTLLHSDQPKLYGVLAGLSGLSAIELKADLIDKGGKTGTVAPLDREHMLKGKKHLFLGTYIISHSQRAFIKNIKKYACTCKQTAPW